MTRLRQDLHLLFVSFDATGRRDRQELTIHPAEEPFVPLVHAGAGFG